MSNSYEPSDAVTLKNGYFEKYSIEDHSISYTNYFHISKVSKKKCHCVTNDISSVKIVGYA